MITQLIVFCVLALGTCLPIIKAQNQLSRIKRSFTHLPVMVVYQKSNQLIQEYEHIYQRVWQQVKDHGLIILVNCQESLKLDAQRRFNVCEAIAKRDHQMVHIQGFKPSESMVSVRGKLFEMTPKYFRYEKLRDQSDLYDLMEELTPNYVQKLYSQSDIKKYLGQGSYKVPKVFIYTDGEVYPSVRRLAVHFHQRAKFAEVLALRYNQTKVIVYTFNFRSMEWQKHQFPHKKINMKEYANLKEFIETHASTERVREDYQSLKLGPTNITITDHTNLTETLFDLIDRYSFVFNGKVERGMEVLQKYRDKYGDYFNYIINTTESARQGLYMSRNRTIQLPTDQPQLYKLESHYFDQLEGNAQTLLDKHGTVMLVEPSVDYLCSIETLQVLTNFFRCYPIIQQDVQKVKQKFNVPKQQKLAMVFSNSEGKFMGLNVNNLTFKNVLKVTYSIVHEKVEALALGFIQNPLLLLPAGSSFVKICTTCFFYLHDRTSPNYVNINNYRTSALEHNLEFRFGETDYKCGSAFFKEIGKKPQDMLVFINNGTIFYTKEVSQQVVNKIIRKWKQGTLKTKALDESVKVDQECDYRDPSQQSLVDVANEQL